MARASSSFSEDEASKRWSMYCCISADTLLAVVATVTLESGVMHEGVGEEGDPARSMGCNGCLPPWAVSSTALASGEQPGSSWDLGTDLLLPVLVVDEVGLLECDRLERGVEGEEDERSSVSGTNSPIRQPTDTSRGTSFSFCGQRTSRDDTLAELPVYTNTECT